VGAFSTTNGSGRSNTHKKGGKPQQLAAALNHSRKTGEPMANGLSDSISPA